jgi:RNase adaptor protein for sRNA GlmZ degradation
VAAGVLIVGPSGSGKTTGIRSLNAKETFIINADRKALPIKGWKTDYKTIRKSDGKVDMTVSNYLELNDPTQILQVMQYISKSRPEIKVITLDTLNHMMTSEFLKKAKNAGFQKFVDIALDTYNILSAIPDLREDLTVFVVGHNEVAFDAEGGKVNKLRTIGKMLDEKVNIESLFTTVLYTSVDTKDAKTPYGFLTQTDGSSTGKSPLGMFDEGRIPNDYSYVLEKIKQYEN